jgi:serine/threonine protein kinase
MGDASEQMVGKTFGHFELVGPLGRGGMGQVYRALDTSLQRYVAVKILRSGIGTSTNATSSDREIDMLLQEAIAQARVTHPNIVTIYFVGKEENAPFLAMELINGKPLSEMIAERGENSMDYNTISSIATQISEALRYSFELDIIHGDIKPSNVLIQHDGTAKLSDFGMARRVSQEQDRSLGGTPNYIAPEMLNGAPTSIHSDIYALGVTLYEMSFGKLPIKLSGRTVKQWIDSHESAEIKFPEPWPEHLPEQWKHVLEGMLAKKTEQRYASYEPLIEDLKSINPGTQVAARRIPRLIAAMIDILIVLLLVAPLQALIGLQMIYDFQPSHQIASIIMRLLDLSSLIAYTVLVFFWRQSIGRKLMHLRVVNEYGLSCSGKVMVVRSLIRMVFVWAILAGGLIDYRSGNVSTVASVVQLLGGILLALNLAFFLIYEKGKSLHDLICKTRVVLDT